MLTIGERVHPAKKGEQRGVVLLVCGAGSLKLGRKRRRRRSEEEEEIVHQLKRLGIYHGVPKHSISAYSSIVRHS